MDTSESLRLFFALWPDDTTRAELASLQTMMQGQITPYENLHLTLAFLGKQPATLVPDLKEILDHLPRTHITLTLDRIGYFPRKRIAWAGTHQVPDEMLVLQNTLTSTLIRQEVLPDTQGGFKAHVTLARNAEPPPDTAFAPIVWRAGQLALVESTTLPTGSRYRVLASRSLAHDVRVTDEAGNAENDAFLKGQ